MTMTDKVRAQRYLELAGKVIEGPWVEEHEDGTHRRVWSTQTNGLIADCGWLNEDSNFIAASRTEGPYFTQKFLETVEEIERLREALERIAIQSERIVLAQLQSADKDGNPFPSIWVESLAVAMGNIARQALEGVNAHVES